VKGYGEYVLKFNSEDFNDVQKYLIYSKSDSDTKGTKPFWFDNLFP